MGRRHRRRPGREPLAEAHALDRTHHPAGAARRRLRASAARRTLLARGRRRLGLVCARQRHHRLSARVESPHGLGALGAQVRGPQPVAHHLRHAVALPPPRPVPPASGGAGRGSAMAPDLATLRNLEAYGSAFRHLPAAPDRRARARKRSSRRHARRRTARGHGTRPAGATRQTSPARRLPGRARHDAHRWPRRAARAHRAVTTPRDAARFTLGPLPGAPGSPGSFRGGAEDFDTIAAYIITRAQAEARRLDAAAPGPSTCCSRSRSRARHSQQA